MSHNLMLQVKICDSNFENNNIAIQQALNELREERELIRNVEQQLKDLGKTKVLISNIYVS